MKKTVLEYTTDTYQEDIPKQLLQENMIRLNSFFSEQESVQKKGSRLIFKYTFYSVENPRKATKQYLLKEYAKLPLAMKCIQPEQIPSMEQYKEIILYGDETSPKTQEKLTEYLQKHDSLKDEQTIAYAELQKALFFCKRKRIPLLFVSVKEMVNDIRFLNMLEESYVDFRCIDFPWFCKENLRLIKAVVLYKKLQTK